MPLGQHFGQHLRFGGQSIGYIFPSLASMFHHPEPCSGHPSPGGCGLGSDLGNSYLCSPTSRSSTSGNPLLKNTANKLAIITHRQKIAVITVMKSNTLNMIAHHLNSYPKCRY